MYIVSRHKETLLMGWIMTTLDGMVTKRQRKELETFLAGLRSMSDAEMAELIVFATHRCWARH